MEVRSITAAIYSEKIASFEQDDEFNLSSPLTARQNISSVVETSTGGGWIYCSLGTGPDATISTDVPETSTWAMMLLGFAGIGVAG